MGVIEELVKGVEAVETGVGAIQHVGRYYAPGVEHQQSDLSRAAEAILKAGERHKINPAYLWGIFGVETSYGSQINVSRTGARGPFQFEPGTAEQYGYPLGVNEHGITDWNAFAKQADAAAAFLAAHGGTKNIQGAVRAYNPGEASYLSKVIAHAQSFHSPFATEAENKAETAKVENNPWSPESGTWAKLAELGLTLIFVLAGALLLVYGVAVAVRPREGALSLPKMPAVVPV